MAAQSNSPSQKAVDNSRRVEPASVLALQLRLVLEAEEHPLMASYRAAPQLVCGQTIQGRRKNHEDRDSMLKRLWTKAQSKAQAELVIGVIQISDAEGLLHSLLEPEENEAIEDDKTRASIHQRTKSSDAEVVTEDARIKKQMYG